MLALLHATGLKHPYSDPDDAGVCADGNDVNKHNVPANAEKYLLCSRSRDYLRDISQYSK
jgi:hypothetical protein